MLERLVAACLAVVLLGCSSKPNPAAPMALPRSIRSTQNPTPQDTELDGAIAKARETLDGFIHRLEHPQRGEVFSVEAVFPALDGTPEHLWIGDVTYKDGVFTGTLTSKPSKATALKYGEPAHAKRVDVTDWMILASGRSEGGYTVEVLMRRQGQPR